MKTGKFSEEQVAYVLRLSRSATPVSDVRRQMGVSEATFHVSRKTSADLGVWRELCMLRQLTEQNARLARIVGDFTLDEPILQEVIEKRSDASTQGGVRIVDPRAIPIQHGALLRAGEDPVQAGATAAGRSGSRR